MFSRDNKHYRPTPRTLQQAFGPHAEWNAPKDRRSTTALIVIGWGVAIAGIFFIGAV